MTQPPPSPSGYYPPPDEPPSKKRTRQAIVGGLGVAASVATILTLVITLNQQPQSRNTDNSTNSGGSTSVNAYPANIQSNFLNSCEASGPRQVCECSLSWFESNVPISQFQQDETMIEQGGRPADIVSVEQACG